MQNDTPTFRPRKADRRKPLSHKVIFPIELPDGSVIEGERRQALDRRANGIIARQSLFHEVTWDFIETLIEQCPLLTLQAGELLLSPERDNDHLYLVKSGKLMAHLEAADSEEGFPIFAGQFTGDMSIIDGKRPSAFVVAETDTTVVAVYKDIFWSSVTRDPTVARNMMALFAERIRIGNESALAALEKELTYRHLQKELESAHNIQLSMLPRLPLLVDVERVRAHAYMKAARDVGGDFYDVIKLDDKHIYMAIGDVSGKGMPASLFMVKTMTLLRDCIFRSCDLSLAAFNVNNALCENNDSNMFVTLFMALLDTESGRLNYINAGHNNIYMGNNQQGYTALKNTNGILMGVMENIDYELGQAQLEQGQTLVLYTDGVTEAENISKALYGEEFFVSELASLPAENPVAMIEGILDSLTRHVKDAPQSDDITLVSLHRFIH